MADDCDRSSATEEQQRAVAIAKRKPSGPPACGFCHNCGEPTAGPFCDPECRDDYQRANAHLYITFV